MDGDEVFHRLVAPARLAPAVAARLGVPGCAALLLDAEGRELLACTAPASALASALRAGLLGPAPFAAAARPPLPTERPRLERLALDPGRLRPPTLCACAGIETADGRTALLVVAAGPLPPLRVEAPPPVEAAPSAPEAVARFVWASDAEDRLAEISPSFAETIGLDLAGATWDDLLGTRALDPEGRLAAALAGRATFRGIPVHWRLRDSAEAVPGLLSGTPLRDAAHAFAGFNGFGLIRPAQRIAVPPLPAPPPAAEVRPEEIPPAADRAVASPSRASPPEPSQDEVMPPERFPVEAAPAASAPIPAPAPAPPAPVDAFPVFALAGATMAEFAEIVATPLAHFGMTWAFAPPPAPAETRAEEAAAPVRETVPPVVSEPDAAEPTTLPPRDDPPPHAASGSAPPEPPRDETVLSFNEHAAFREIALRLAGRFNAGDEGVPEDGAPVPARYGEVTPFPAHAVSRRAPSETPPEDPVHHVLDRIPVGLLVHRGDAVLFANRALLDLLGFRDVADLAEAGLGRVLPGQEVPSREVPSREIPNRERPLRADGAGTPCAIALVPRNGGTVPAEALRTTLAWEGAPAALLVVRRLPEVDPAQGLAAAELALQRREARLREARAVLDAVPDGVVTVDAEDRVVDFNEGARALFGHDPREVVGEPVAFLFAPRDRARALAFMHRVRGAGTAAVLEPELHGTAAAAERLVALSAAPLALDGPGAGGRLGLVLRDVTALRRAEADLRLARRSAETLSARKADLLAAMAQGIRTPLDRIATLAATLLDAPAASPERTREGVLAIQAAGAQVGGLVDDLADLARIEAGRAELAFSGVALNDLVARCVAVMQPEAARERIVVRTSFASNLPAVLADEGAMRRAALNVIGDAIRLTDPGGQVIVSTALSERGEVVLRVRDTGAGMSPEEVRAALRPLDGRAPDRRGAPGLGLPLVKALVEANRGSLQVTSGKDAGTLVEVVFPPGRVLAG